MHYDTRKKRDHGLPYNPFKALVAPRPIGWISTVSATGVVNLAPYSFFNAVADFPPMVMFSSTGIKHSQINAEATGEFVCNLVSYELRDEMVGTSAEVGPEVSEPELVGLEMAPSVYVKPPRVARAPAALECKYLKTVPLHGIDGVQSESQVIIGQVIGVYIDDAVITDGMVDLNKIQPVARLGYADYSAVDRVFKLKWDGGEGLKRALEK
jgi:flavin reductase (DIM6/NTAB) family NADH-FMN oxidoreductase RutF